MDATTSGFEMNTAWLPAASVTVAPARFAMNCWAVGGIILSAVVTKYQLGLVRHAGVVTRYTVVIPDRPGVEGAELLQTLQALQERDDAGHACSLPRPRPS